MFIFEFLNKTLFWFNVGSKWLGRETRQPFLCKRAIITMTSILKPPWFKAWRCVYSGFSVFYFTFFIFSYPGNAPPWQNPCIDDTIHLRSYFFLKFSSMKWIIKQILLVLTTIRFDQQIIVNSRIGNKEMKIVKTQK